MPRLTLTFTATQTAEDIARIVRQAQHPPAGPAGWDQDECAVARLNLCAVIVGTLVACAGACEVHLSLSCTTIVVHSFAGWYLTLEYLCRYIDDAMDAEAYESQTFDECEHTAYQTVVC